MKALLRLRSVGSAESAPVHIDRNDPDVDRKFLSDVPFKLGVMWLLLCVVVAIFANWLQVYDFQAIDLRARLTPPVGLGGSWNHPLGTDELGRDVMSRLVASIQVSLALATAGAALSIMIGTVMGFLAAHFRGLVDDAIMVMSDIQAALPFFMIALVSIAILGPSVPLFVILLGLFGWERYARLARAMALSANEHGYAEALRGLGLGPLRIYWRHILPNISSVLIVNATLSFSETLLLESTLSFLGLGIQPPLSSLGNMVGFGRETILSAWWVVASPALVILFCSLALAIVGDRLRDYLDPELP